MLREKFGLLPMAAADTGGIPARSTRSCPSSPNGGGRALAVVHALDGFTPPTEVDVLKAELKKAAGQSRCRKRSMVG